jgi:hypothetical protein
MPANQPFRWAYQSDEAATHPVEPILGRYLLPDGSQSATAPPALAALMPPFQEEMLAKLLPVPEPGASCSDEPPLRSEPWPPELWSLPEHR